jgi:peroxiredoxin
LAAAAAAVAFPAWFAAWFGPPAPAAVELSHILITLTAAMGAACVLAARNPFRHWPTVLMALVAKLAAAVWLAADTLAGRLPERAWLAIAFDDAIWLGPLAMVLKSAYDAHLDRCRAATPEVLSLALRRKTGRGVTLDELSRIGPTLVVFLRHAGCPFCREALSDIARLRPRLEAEGARLVLVHLSGEAEIARLLAIYGLADTPRIHDPHGSLYRAFGLPRGSLSDVAGPKVWWRGCQAVFAGRHRVAFPDSDAFQMPGVFLLFHGEILRSYRHQSAADRPDYLALVTGRGYAAPELRQG